MNRFTLLVLAIVSVTGCSSGPTRKTEPMTKWTAPEMRIAVYAPRLSAVSEAQVQDALASTGRFWIVSRGNGLEAIVSEQDMTHKFQLDRFDDRQKWAHWGKIHGVGAVILAQDRCNEVMNYGGHLFLRCQQSLQMIDASTGELIASAVEIADGETDRLPPGWEDAVKKLGKNIPKLWVEKVYEGRAAQREIDSESHSLVMKKKHAVKEAIKVEE